MILDIAMNLDKIKNYLLKKKEEKILFYNSEPHYQCFYKLPWCITDFALRFFIKLSLFPFVMSFYLSNMKDIFLPTLNLKQIDINFVLENTSSLLLSLLCIAIIILIGIKMILSPLNKGINLLVSKIIKKIKGKDAADMMDNDDILYLVQYLEKNEMRAFLKNKKKLNYSDMLCNIEKYENFNNVKIKSCEDDYSEKLEEYLDCIYENKQINKFEA